jgi:hypothetical protein
MKQRKVYEVTLTQHDLNLIFDALSEFMDQEEVYDPDGQAEELYHRLKGYQPR